LESIKRKNSVLIEVDGCALYAMEGDDHVHSTSSRVPSSRLLFCGS
jgi:hypothetical protein